MSRIQEATRSIQDSIHGISKVVEGAPEQALLWQPSAEAWSILQILRHLDEALPYWLKELQTALPNADRVWGRGLSDPVRLAAIEGASDGDADDLLKQLHVEGEKACATLQTFSDSQLDVERISRNPKFGAKPMWFIVDHMIVEHLQKHSGQILRNIEQYIAARHGNK